MPRQDQGEPFYRISMIEAKEMYDEEDTIAVSYTHLRAHET